MKAMSTIFKIGITVLLSITNLTVSAQTKLIEFGWDYPDAHQLSKNLPSMQSTPFDGICFSIQRTIMEAFDTIKHNESYFEYPKLKKLQWGKYTDNFIILRGFGKSGGRWFDDKVWRIFLQNMNGLSKALLAGHIKGIMFDPEYYYENTFYNPWTYSKIQYPMQNFEEVQIKVKKRGTDFIRALQKYKTDISFLSIWITSLIAEEKKYTSIQDTRHALLISFIEGILEGKNKGVTVIDGNEYAYWNYKPSQFLESPELLKKITLELMKSNKAKRAVPGITIAQPIFYDGLMGRAPSFERGFDNTAKWKWLAENTKYAMAASKSIVWFYSERLDWWKGEVNDTLIEILQKTKAAFDPNWTLKNSSFKRPFSNSTLINEGKGYYYFTDIKTPMKTGKMAFSFSWNPATKNFQLHFIEKIPRTVVVFANNITTQINTPKKLNLIIKLENFFEGKIIVLAKYDTKIEASGIQLYYPN